MALQIGIVGLPNVGKSTLFNALTRSHSAEAKNYPFCTIEPNVGIVEVPDDRLDRLAAIVKPVKVMPAAIEFLDIAGLVRGAHKGEGLGNQFLAAIREVNAICHVVRHFEDSSITHVEGDIRPKRDREIVEMELIIADLTALEKRGERISGAAKSGDKERQRELAVYGQLKATLDAGRLAIETAFQSEEERGIANAALLLTFKPIIYTCNIAEDKLRSLKADDIRGELGLSDRAQVILISAKIEEDLSELSPEEARAFLGELGVGSSGLDQLIRAAYDALGYITYFTAGPKEVRAWNVTRGTTAPQAAGVIHSDFEKGFIRAETISYNDYVACGSELAAKEAGKLRQEGKDYVVRDGDVMHFKFNV